MIKTKSQHYNFVYEALPILFHHETNEFMKYLERDGLKFLNFWWDDVGGKLDKSRLLSSEGLAYKIHDLGKDKKITIITFPPPKTAPEAYYAALYSTPIRRFAWVRLPTTRLFILHIPRIKDTGTPSELGELTPRAIYRALEDGPEPDPQAFMDIVKILIKVH